MAEGLGMPLAKATLLPSSIAISQSVGKIAFGQLAVWFRQINAVYFCQVFLCCLLTLTNCILIEIIICIASNHYQDDLTNAST